MKVYVWGTGCGAGDLIDRGLEARDICAFLDGEGRGGSFLGRPVITPEALRGMDFDLILVASRQAEAISARAEELGLDPEYREGFDIAVARAVSRLNELCEL